jgi:hypothetical protein
MSFYAFDGYCYPDLTSVSIAYRADVISGGNNIISILDYFDRPSFGDTVIYYDTQYTDQYQVSSYMLSGQTIQRYPVCDFVGPLSTQSGLTVDDAILLTSSILLVWALAWSIKILRRAL